MINTILSIVKYSGLFISSFYGFIKLSKIRLRPINIIDIFIGVLLGTSLYFATTFFKQLIPIGLLLFTFIHTLLRYRKNVITTAILSVIACGLSIVTSAVAFLATMPLSFIAFNFIKHIDIRNSLTIITSCAFQLLFVFFLYKIKRFKSGISLNNNDGSLELLLLISIFSIFILALSYTKNVASSPFELIIITLIFCGLCFIVWLKKHITNNYQKQIFKRNESLYEQRITEFEKENEELKCENEKLSKIIHRDNKLIPAILIAVNEIIKSSDNNAQLRQLLEQVEELSIEHRCITNEYQNHIDKLPKAGIVVIDAILHFLNTKALKYGIELNVEIAYDSVQSLINAISEITDLSTILCDLGENAIIATSKNKQGKVKIVFEMSDNEKPSISFYDNGAAIEDKVIMHMGRKRITTHQSDGGSGIGLMTLFDILGKNNASFCLDEAPRDSEYTKQIKISFDELHSLSIISNRETIKRICFKRQDISFISSSSTNNNN